MKLHKSRNSKLFWSVAKNNAVASHTSIVQLEATVSKEEELVSAGSELN